MELAAVGSMGSVEIVELLPGSELLVQIDIIGVRQQLVELLLVGSMRSLDLAIQLRGSRFDVYVPDTLVLHVPMEAGLPLMSAIRTHRMDAEERKLLDHVVDKVKSIELLWLCLG